MTVTNGLQVHRKTEASLDCPLQLADGNWQREPWIRLHNADSPAAWRNPCDQAQSGYIM